MKSETQLIELDIIDFEEYLKNSSPLSSFSQSIHVKGPNKEV